MARKVFDADYDFIGFTYNGYHSIDDLKIYRVSDGDRYNFDLSPVKKDITAEIPGGDGMYYFNSYYTKKDFNIKIAFDSLYEEDLHKLVDVFDGQSMHELIFDEYPYKVYDAKVSQPPQLQCVCFDTLDGKRIYKGEGTLKFTCFQPFAHTPERNNSVSGKLLTTVDFPMDSYVQTGEYCIVVLGPVLPTAISIDTIQDQDYFTSELFGSKTIPFSFPQSTTIINVKLMFDGLLDRDVEASIVLKLANIDGTEKALVDENYSGANPESYGYTITKQQWLPSSGLTKTVCFLGENYGDLPAPFTLTYSKPIDETTVINVGDAQIVVYGGQTSTGEKIYTDLEWRADTGLVLARTNGKEKAPIYFTGNSMAKIPVGAISYSNIYVKQGEREADIISQDSDCPIKLNYHYWYY